MQTQFSTAVTAWRNGEMIRSCAENWTEADIETYRAAYIKAFDRPDEIERLERAAALGVPALIFALEDAAFDRLALN